MCLQKRVAVSEETLQQDIHLAHSATTAPPQFGVRLAHKLRLTIIFLISAMALAGFKLFGQAFAQFMIVWQR